MSTAATEPGLQLFHKANPAARFLSSSMVEQPAVNR